MAIITTGDARVAEIMAQRRQQRVDDVNQRTYYRTYRTYRMVEPVPSSAPRQNGAAWQAVTFYTTGTGYEQEVKNLIKSATALNVPLKVYDYPPTGTWRGNLNYKSACILRAFNEFRDKDIVFVDADAIIRRNPTLFDELSAKREYDISACFFKYDAKSGDADELLSGTLWIKNNDTGRATVRRWHEVGLTRPDVRHQMCLKAALEDMRREGIRVRVNRHSLAYTCIFDYHAARNVVPVIEHFQASRRLRKDVGRGQQLKFRRDP
jgi:hypothetical protein